MEKIFQDIQIKILLWDQTCPLGVDGVALNHQLFCIQLFSFLSDLMYKTWLWGELWTISQSSPILTKWQWHHRWHDIQNYVVNHCTAIATRHSTRYSDILLQLDSNSTLIKKPPLAGACALIIQLIFPFRRVGLGTPLPMVLLEFMRKQPDGGESNRRTRRVYKV